MVAEQVAFVSNCTSSFSFSSTFASIDLVDIVKFLLISDRFR
jgi:hypothetical protein